MKVGVFSLLPRFRFLLTLHYSFAKSMPTLPDNSRGRVFLVGAGPGDPNLLTLRGAECLRRADLVLYDYLVNPRILVHAAQAEKVCLGRHGHGRILSQDEICERLISAARQGQQVVRLKSGDPLVFGRAGEELAALAAASVAYEIVPGITAALASGSYAGIPLTHRDWASAVALVTGQEQSGKEATDLDFAALAKFPGTLVFYMGVTTARHWSGQLIASGKSPNTPVAIVRRCSWPDQMTVLCTLGTVAAEMEQQHLRPPVLVVVGEVAGLAPVASWFVERPLFGQRVLVTRPAEQAGRLLDRLEELGAECLLQPAIQIGPPEDFALLDTAIQQLHRYDWLVFSSANGVNALCERIWTTGGDLRSLGRAKLAAIGPGTADELAKYHLRADLLPHEFRAESLAEALIPHCIGKQVLLIRASRGREVLAEQLTSSGARVEQVVAYSSHDVTIAEPGIAEALSAGRIDWITVTSSAIARSLVTLFGENLRHTKLASISPITTATLLELGHAPTVEAAEYTMDGVVQAMVKAIAIS